MIRELVTLLEASLVKVASHPSCDEGQKISESLQQVKDTAEALEVVWKAREHLTPEAMKDYEFAKSKVLVYLLYYDRVGRYLKGDATPGDWYATDMFRPADYYDWRKAQVEARKLFVKYVKEQIT